MFIAGNNLSFMVVQLFYFLFNTIYFCHLAELYRQGDLEKEYGFCPLPRLDREKAHTIPEIQIEYFNILVLPCFNVLKKIFPNTVTLYKEAE